MPLPFITDTPETSISANTALAMLPAQRGDFTESAALDFTGEKPDSVELTGMANMPPPMMKHAMPVSPSPAERVMRSRHASFTLKEPGNALDQQDTEPRTEYLLRLIASLESCNTALLTKLNQIERELAVLKQSPVHISPGTESTDGPGLSYGLERKLTRAGWRL